MIQVNKAGYKARQDETEAQWELRPNEVFDEFKIGELNKIFKGYNMDHSNYSRKAI